MFQGYRVSVSGKVFRVGNGMFLALLALVTLYPFWYVIQASFSDPTYKIALLWPREFFYINYWLVFTKEGIGRAYLMTVLRVVTAVPLMLVVTGATAFALTRNELKGRKLIILYYFITMFVSGGLIPFYMMLKTIGLLDTFIVFILPTVFSVWTMIVMKTSFQGLPEGLVEAGLIDGASYGRIFFQIILPLSIPMITTLGLFQAVWHWNDWFYGAFYIKNPKLRPLQTFLRYAVLTTGSLSISNVIGGEAMRYPERYSEDPRIVMMLLKVTPEAMKQAYIVVTTVPIIILYPFVQKFFIKGVLIGSIKE